ncbi:hypothetical protein GCM10029963_62020 [Micromonospora andamanensis]|uniref:hypothetical protein n=1 Tax=Micromonospora andamanensis TaxID=1287068 RepID=UPI00195048CB|nr:hypothetical protein [Micromonospora andamanensis]GIJ41606.1 hypothetical protein Vwe01_49310 [Micromonospora andamanensis]
MSRLEERYRRVLRLLPVGYRRQWEDDMVAAFLETMQTGDAETDEYLADHGRPSLAEVTSVLSLAARLRVGGADAPPRPYAWGQAVRLAVLTGVLLQAVMATAGLAVTLWLSGALGWLPAPTSEWVVVPPASSWQATLSVAGYAWLPAFLALVLGHRRVAQAVAAVAVVPQAVAVAVEQATGPVPLTVTPWAMLLVELLLLVAMSAFQRDAAAVARRPWLLALPIGILAVPVPLFLAQATMPALRLLDWPGLCCVLVVVAMAVNLVACASRPPVRTLPWSLALVLLAAAALALRIATLPDIGAQVQRTALLTTAAGQIVAVLAVGVPLAVVAFRALRHLPPVPAAEEPHRTDS